GRADLSSETDPGLMVDQGIPFIEDSLVMLYRRDAHYPWAVWPNVTISYLGQHTDRLAKFTINGLAAGDYTVAWKSSAVGIAEANAAAAGWRYYPDPADDTVTIERPANTAYATAQLRVIDVKGRTLLEQRLTGDRARIDLSHIAPQTVLLQAVRADGGTTPIGRLVIAR
ncbi:MAG TPA: hypothetical protein VHL57_05370, partial [Flavobacteriales bacterium]|nr:hypothetical protein [Flavobacteriales bacterium]